jgi:hypothetical protein
VVELRRLFDAAASGPFGGAEKCSPCTMKQEGEKGKKKRRSR